MKQKSKQERYSLSVVSKFIFLLLWIISVTAFSAFGHTIAMKISSLIVQRTGSPILGDALWRLVMLEALLVASFTAPVQKILLRWLSGQWIKGWITATVLSTIITLMPFMMLTNFNLQHLMTNTVSNIPIIVLTTAISALPYVWILRRYINKSWVFFGAKILASLIPIFLPSFLQSVSFAPSLTIASTTAILATTLLLFSWEKPEEERTEQEYSIRYDRLVDTTPQNNEAIADDGDKLVNVSSSQLIS